MMNNFVGSLGATGTVGEELGRSGTTEVIPLDGAEGAIFNKATWELMR